MALERRATVLAIGTALPSGYCKQADFAESFFERAESNTKNETLKAKMRSICEKSGIIKRHFHVQPRYDPPKAASLTERFAVATKVVPKLMAEAANKAIAEWGRPATDITHVVLGTITGMEAPGADFRLIKLLGLRPDVQRVMLYFQGCAAGASGLRIAKDLAENNPGSRVLVACCEMASLLSHAMPEEELQRPAHLVSCCIFGDGASCVIVGGTESAESAVAKLERPLFEICDSKQLIIPGTDDYINVEMHEHGVTVNLTRDVPAAIAASIAGILQDFLGHRHPADDLFWVVHPGGRAILDVLTSSLQLQDATKLDSSRRILSSCGNMSSASIFFVLDETRRRSQELKLATTGEGYRHGAVLAFGPGMTVELLLLKSFEI